MTDPSTSISKVIFFSVWYINLSFIFRLVLSPYCFPPQKFTSLTLISNLLCNEGHTLIQNQGTNGHIEQYCLILVPVSKREYQNVVKSSFSLQTVCLICFVFWSHYEFVPHITQSWVFQIDVSQWHRWTSSLLDYRVWSFYWSLCSPCWQCISRNLPDHAWPC